MDSCRQKGAWSHTQQSGILGPSLTAFDTRMHDRPSLAPVMLWDYKQQPYFDIVEMCSWNRLSG